LPPPRQAARALVSELGVSLTLAELLIARGYNSAASAREFLHPSLAMLPDPLGLRDMDLALARLLRAIRNREKIQIHGDYDVDGTTSTVIIKRAIEIAGGEASYRIPNRLREGYGMHRDTVEAAAAMGVTLIISVDTGIRAGEVVEHARSFGIDVIVTDHHLPETELPRAVAVVNPNRADCTYAGKNLCGAGVAFKLVQALLSTLPWPAEKLHRVLESFLKLVAIGTVADVVPLTGENRVIVRYGLRGLAVRKNPGLEALFDVAGMKGGSPTAGQVAFRIAPRINAAGRMADAGEVVEMFLTADAARARAIAAQLHEWNAERQGEEARIVEEVLAACALEPVGDADGSLVFCAENWHRGVLGIVASRLVERYCRPVFVLSIENGVARGSGRSVSGVMLLDALDSMPELFTQYGGHSHAAGLSMPAAHVNEFRERFSSYAGDRLPPEDRRPGVRVDAVVESAAVNTALFEDLQLMEPFGIGNPEPVFALLGCEVCNFQLMKEKHVRLAVRSAGRMLFLKGFNLAERAAEMAPGNRIDIAFTLSADNFSGGWAAILKDVRESEDVCRT
jgi:single-stranded-DNA-specific exonuclease